MKIISIANQKGGCGKTTTAINLASALSLNGKRVLLFDLDPQAHASLGLDIESQDSIYNVISRLTPRKLKLENIIKKVENSFDIVPSNILVGTLEQELSDEIGRELKLMEVIKPIRDQYDYVLIDCPPSLGILTINAIRVSEQLIIPVETSRFSMQGVEHLMDIVHLVKERLNHSVDCRILVTMFDSRLRHSFAMLSTFKERFNKLLFDTIVHINVKLKESAVMGKPVAFYDKYCRGSKDYYTLAKELIFEDKQTGAIDEVKQQVKKQPEIKVEKIKEKKEKIEEPVVAKEPELEKTSWKNRLEEEILDVQEDAQEIKLESKSDAKEQVKEEVVDEVEQEETAAEEQKPVEATFQPLSSRMKELVREEAKDFFRAKFSIEAPGAKSVYVTGSFNDWSLDDNCRLKNKGDGNWETEIDLKPGVYKYQFIVDGVWKEDPKNPQKERNSFGDINSLIEVK
ncbi:MAG: AAA family ATPase [Candidatus Omnitrophica bacterium]|nr:AAA family ATPase [Candidatus Omnitrophota bacterium]MCB9747759.1 AAA family ATPase [Candidatus Omnitrophota bacterium]